MKTREPVAFEAFEAGDRDEVFIKLNAAGIVVESVEEARTPSAEAAETVPRAGVGPAAFEAEQWRAAHERGLAQRCDVTLRVSPGLFWAATGAITLGVAAGGMLLVFAWFFLLAALLGAGDKTSRQSALSGPGPLKTPAPASAWLFGLTAQEVFILLLAFGAALVVVGVWLARRRKGGRAAGGR